MDTQYQPLYRQAASMQSKFHDYTHTVAYDPAAKVLRNQIHNLTNDLASGKSPRMIDSRIRTIQNQLRRNQMSGAMMPQGQSQILKNNQTQMLHQNFERMRQNIRQHPNF